MTTFGRQTLLLFVFKFNKLEGTLPSGYNDMAVYPLLEEELDGMREEDLEAAPPLTWPAEGGGSTQATKQQLLQSLKAVKYMCSPLKVPLSVERICTAHKLLMWGAVEDDGTLLAAGQLRTTSAHSGTGYVYPPAGSIEEQLQKMVDDFNVAASCAGAVPSHLAAELLYRFLTLHPFQNGNGRMARLLAAYAAHAAVVPFMLLLTNQHRKARQRFQQALLHADKHGRDTSRLQSFVLECMHVQWQNAVAYSGGEGHAGGREKGGGREACPPAAWTQLCCTATAVVACLLRAALTMQG